MKQLKIAIACLAVLAIAAITLPGVAKASPPANDNFADATVISTLPFTDSGDLNGTTTEPGEPQFCNFQAQTVWYAFTPTVTTAISADLNGSDFGVVFNVYQSFGSGFGGLGFTGCVGSEGSTEFTADAGTTYYIQAGSISVGPAHLQLNLHEVPPPPNDNFAAATTITALPFSDSTDRSAATTEVGEPLNTSCSLVSHTIWYAFTPNTTNSFFASGVSAGNSMLTVYTGDSLTNLTELGCGVDRLLFHAEAGHTYFIQVGSFDGQPGTQQSFSLDVAPPLAMAAFFNPPDPSIFDTVQFADATFDPAGPGTIKSEQWTFGDGSSATGCCPTHRYAADGVYTGTLTDMTFDGRTGSTQFTITVKTHDVAITKFLVPQVSRVGQTRAISVGISDSRSPETVQVQLLKSVPGSVNNFQLVGTLTQSVPVLPANRTTPFDFNYTFTSDDAAAGKVTFEAVATILGARDAQPGDNTVITLPTKVNP
jgi:hypothetical protein